MAPEVLARVFEPFFSTKDVGQGTGLGLAQVYGFARQSGGAARVSSRLGEGTTMTLLLPRAAPTLPAGVVAVPPTPVPLEKAKPLRLLLVEDDDAVAELTGGDAAASRPYASPASPAAGGGAADLAEGLAVDLVLTDVVMTGGQDGLDLARRLGEQRPGLPILLYSGYGGAPARVAAAGLPLLRKPYSLEELRRALVAARLREAARRGGTSWTPPLLLRAAFLAERRSTAAILPTEQGMGTGTFALPNLPNPPRPASGGGAVPASSAARAAARMAPPPRSGRSTNSSSDRPVTS